ncbi:sensor histidine kinase [Hathewaya massiliensis]|uniref:sensor histidine kinase n=1 Tax=Hathewaya massiliensis TaxID=1964382 RepID=UPI00115BE653|nr:ATP-binding protein [Hathewaya massiliensis]
MLDFLQQFAIFFVELISYMFIWSKFIYKEHDTSIGKNFIIVVVASVLSSINMIYFYNKYSMFTNYIIIILLTKFFYKKSLIKLILEFLIVLVISMLLQLGVVLVGKFMGFNYSSTFQYHITGLTIELILVIIIYRAFFFTKNFKIFSLDSKIIFYFLINFGFYFMMFRIIWSYNKFFIVNNLILTLFTLLVILTLNLFLYEYIFKITEEKKVLEVQNKYNPILGDIIEETRRRQHDFKNYLNIINGIVEVCEEKELKGELKKYIKSLGVLNKNIEDITYIDNVIIKSLVYSKLCEAERNDIGFSFNIRNGVIEQYLNDYEISDILGNFLNNAFEAVQYEEDKRVILNIFLEGEESIVEVRNAGKTIAPENIESIFKKGFSTKANKGRGYGLYNIKRIVEQHNGKVQLFFEDDYTVFRILFIQKTFRGVRLSKKNIAFAWTSQKSNTH